MTDDGPLLQPGEARVLRTDAGLYWLEPDGLVGNRILVAYLTSDHMRQGLKAMLELTGGKPAAILTDAGPVAGAAREGRDIMSGPEGAAAIAALAVVVPSPVTAIVVNLFTRLARPAFPTRMFTSVDEARAWALPYVVR